MPTIRRRKNVRTARPARRRTVRTRRPMRRRRVVGISRQPFPREKFVSLRYNDTGTLSSVVGATAVQVYNLNSLYDPDSTGTGHQPRFFDTFCGADGTSAPYGSYRVHSAKITVTFMNSNAGVTTVGYIGLHTRLSTAAALTTDTYIPELPNTKYRMINVSTGMSNFLKMSNAISIKRYLGIKDLKDDDLSAALYSASPSKLVVADLFYYPRDRTATSSIQFDVSIVFNVQFFDQNTVANS